MFWINREYVLKDLQRRRALAAKEQWISIEEYDKIRIERKNKAKGLDIKKNLEETKKWKLNAVEVIWVQNYWSIKWWKIEVFVSDKNMKVSWILRKKGKKPIIVWDMEKLTKVEKCAVNRTIYWYFANL